MSFHRGCTVSIFVVLELSIRPIFRGSSYIHFVVSIFVVLELSIRPLMNSPVDNGVVFGFNLCCIRIID